MCATLRPDTPDWLADLVHGLLAKDADQRPAGAASVAEALSTRSALGGAATTVLPAAGAATTQRLDAVSPPPVVPPLPPREPERPGVSPWVWVLAVVAAVAIGLLLWNLLRDNGADPASTPELDPELDPEHVAAGRDHVGAAHHEASDAHAHPHRDADPHADAEPLATADLAAPVEAALSAFSDEVGVLVRDGTLDQKAAKNLDDGIRNVRRALRDGDPRKVSQESDKLVQDYDKGVQDGSISA